MAELQFEWLSAYSVELVENHDFTVKFTPEYFFTKGAIHNFFFFKYFEAIFDPLRSLPRHYYDFLNHFMKFTKPPAPFLLTQSMDLPKHPKNSQTHSINPHRSLTRALPKIWFWLAFNEPENSGHFLFSSWLPFLSHSRRKSVYLNLLISFRLVFNSWRQSFADQRKSNKRITLISPGICLSRCFVDDIKGKEGERRGSQLFKVFEKGSKSLFLNLCDKLKLQKNPIHKLKNFQCISLQQLPQKFFKIHVKDIK